MTHTEKRDKLNSTALIEQYEPRLKSLMPLAIKAYGLRSTDSPAHVASREYTGLVKEYYEAGGSLVALAKELGITYASLRRRVVMFDMPSRSDRTHSKTEPQDFELALERIKAARAAGTGEYHRQLLTEYENGVSLGKLASALGLSSSNPLYYGVQRARQRSKA